MTRAIEWCKKRPVIQLLQDTLEWCCLVMQNHRHHYRTHAKWPLVKHLSDTLKAWKTNFIYFKKHCCHYTATEATNKTKKKKKLLHCTGKSTYGGYPHSAKCKYTIFYPNKTLFAHKTCVSMRQLIILLPMLLLPQAQLLLVEIDWKTQFIQYHLNHRE